MYIVSEWVREWVSECVCQCQTGWADVICKATLNGTHTDRQLGIQCFTNREPKSSLGDTLKDKPDRQTDSTTSWGKNALGLFMGGLFQEPCGCTFFLNLPEPLCHDFEAICHTQMPQGHIQWWQKLEAPFPYSPGSAPEAFLARPHWRRPWRAP